MKHALSKQTKVPIIARWVLALQDFTFSVKHRPSTNMKHVDALNRNPSLTTDAVETLTINLITENDWLLHAQSADAKVVEIFLYPETH